MTNTEIFDKLRDAIVNQNVAGTAPLCKEALAAGIPALDIITKGLSVGMKIVGDRFEAAEIFLPQIMMSGKAMSNAMEVLTPELEKNKKDGEEAGLAITFVAEGDIHDIGHRLVTTMLGANGFEILDLGVDVLNETVIEEAAKAQRKEGSSCRFSPYDYLHARPERPYGQAKGRKPQGQRKVHVRRSPCIREMD